MFDWFAVILLAALLALIIGMILHPADRLRQPTFWLTAGVALAVLAFFLRAVGAT
jgi:hypothetical protein